MEFQLHNFQADFNHWWVIPCEITLRWLSLNSTNKKVNIGSDNGKPLPAPALTQLFVATWRRSATMS